MGTLVMKFGGHSVGNTMTLTQVLSIILQERERWDKLLVVVSALEGVTDQILEATRLAQISNHRGYRRIIATLRTRHLALVDHLPLGTNERQTILADIDRLLFEMIDQLQSIAEAPREELSPETTDPIIGVGERIAARIIAALVRQNNIRAVAIDSQGLIVTDETFGNAIPDVNASCERIQENLLPMLDRQILPIITGFIGATPDGRITTLGRGGSDYTASVMGICADANEVWIWTDVDGMMTTDPRDIPKAKVIPMMSYQEVAEMAYFGARVLHARMVGPLQEARIPLRIKNVFKPQQPGTLIYETNARQMRSPKAVTTIQALGLRAERSGPLSDIAAIVNKIFVQAAGSPAEVMIASQSSTMSFLCFIIPTSSGQAALSAATELLENELTQNPTDIDWQITPVGVVTVIGSHLNEMPSLIANIFLKLANIPLLATAHGPSNCSFSVVIRQDDIPEAQQRIHDFVLEASGKQH